MISIHKPAAPPEILETRGREESARDQEAYEKSPADYDLGDANFSFRSDIYGHSSVKQALVSAQHGKCCFCEAKITHIRLAMGTSSISVPKQAGVRIRATRSAVRATTG
jgi:hypothetical protein